MSEASDLKPSVREWHVGGKSGGRRVSIPAAVWHVFMAAIPPRYAPKPNPTHRHSSTQRYQKSAKAWRTVTRQLGLDCTLHDLRHLSAQFAEDNGAGLLAIQQQVRHSTLDMTGRYAKRRMRRAASEAASALLHRDSRASELMRIGSTAGTSTTPE